MYSRGATTHKNKGVIMEFLKDFLTEETYNKVTEELNGKDVKLANLKSGEYVSKEKYNNLEGSYNELKTQLNDKAREYDELITKAGDNETLKNEIENLKTDSQNQVAKITATYEAKLKRAAINSGLINAKVKDAKDILGQLDMDKITYENDELKGLDEQLTTIKENKPYLFEEDKSSKSGLNHDGNGGGIDDAQIRAVMGLPPIND